MEKPTDYERELVNLFVENCGSHDQYIIQLAHLIRSYNELLIMIEAGTLAPVTDEN